MSEITYERDGDTVRLTMTVNDMHMLLMIGGLAAGWAFQASIPGSLFGAAARSFPHSNPGVGVSVRPRGIGIGVFRPDNGILILA